MTKSESSHENVEETKEIMSLLRRRILDENFELNEGFSLLLDLLPQCSTDSLCNFISEIGVVGCSKYSSLLLCLAMLKFDRHRSSVGELIAKIIAKPEECCIALWLYFELNKPSLGKKHAAIAQQVKKGLRVALNSFERDELRGHCTYENIRLADVINLVRPSLKTSVIR